MEWLIYWLILLEADEWKRELFRLVTNTRLKKNSESIEESKRDHYVSRCRTVPRSYKDSVWRAKPCMTEKLEKDRLINKPITGWVADKHTYRLTVRLVDWPQNWVTEDWPSSMSDGFALTLTLMLLLNYGTLHPSLTLISCSIQWCWNTPRFSHRLPRWCFTKYKKKKKKGNMKLFSTEAVIKVVRTFVAWIGSMSFDHSVLVQPWYKVSSSPAWL